MKDLIERLEKAVGPDGNLGRAIYLACRWRKTTVGYYMGPQYYWSSPDGKISFDDDKFIIHDPTRSIDAALTLVPDGVHWAVYRNEGDALFSGEVADYCVAAATPAAALSAAALVYLDEEISPRRSPAESSEVK